MLFLAPLYRFVFLPKKIERADYPNFDQSKMSDDPNWQKVLCAPTSTADAILHLNVNAKNPFIKNLDRKSDDGRALAEKLAKYMGTRPIPNPNPGTEPDEVITGIKKFMAENKKELSYEEWRGWGAKQTSRQGVSSPPSYNWIAKQLKKNREVLLHVGMYKKNPNGSYQRVSGHFVTCIGYNKSDLSLKLLDPAPRAARAPKSTTTTTLKNQKLLTQNASLKAKGYIQLNNLDLPNQAEFAVVDGAFAFSC